MKQSDWLLYVAKTLVQGNHATVKFESRAPACHGIENLQWIKVEMSCEIQKSLQNTRKKTEQPWALPWELVGKLAAMQAALSCSELYFARCCSLKQNGTVASENKVMC